MNDTAWISLMWATPGVAGLAAFDVRHTGVIEAGLCALAAVIFGGAR